MENFTRGLESVKKQAAGNEGLGGWVSQLMSLSRPWHSRRQHSAGGAANPCLRPAPGDAAPGSSPAFGAADATMAAFPSPSHAPPFSVQTPVLSQVCFPGTP